MTTATGVDPRTGEMVTEFGLPATEDVRAVAAAAAQAAAALDEIGRAGRANLLRRYADRLDARRADVVSVASRETALSEARLDGEVSRTVGQLRLFASVIDDGGYLEIAIDHANDVDVPQDLRRVLVPVGPVAIFGASNFPLAFSVPGGDTASALAAGCPVVVKAHPSHPATSALCLEELSGAVADTELPRGTVGMVSGLEAGMELVSHPDIRAVSFTGSLSGGRALLDRINARPDPIPFFGELSSLNPLVVSPAAAALRGQQIAAGLVASVTGSGGQLCTKPGLVMVPEGTSGDALVAHMQAGVAELPEVALLNERVYEAYVDGVGEQGRGGRPAGWWVRPVIVESSKDAALPEECFGPTTVVRRYRDLDEAAALIEQGPGSLTISLHAEPSEHEAMARVLRSARSKSGRLVLNGFPTGVAVTWAQHHGGPWPSATSHHTSVGATAIRRFLRPVVYQGFWESWVPEEVRDAHRGLPRRVNGRIESAS